jgi:hypothetical protein
VSTEETESETRPEVLADLLSLVTGVMIPAGVIATWTPREREWAAKWAAAEHLNASDNRVTRWPQPACVKEAAELTASPALAQLAAEEWVNYLTQLQESQRHVGKAEAISIDAARRAVTGLLVLLGPSRRPEKPTWQEHALEDLALHPGGLSAAEIMALGGRNGPSREELHEWLRAGEANGTLESAGFSNWRLKGTRL